ncbi:MAG: thioredoxin family protein [Chitinophagaceae bacterium]|nr:thioredoxin family protein [Chitinophagaceae bacterium]
MCLLASTATSQQFEKVPDNDGYTVIRGIITAKWLQTEFELSKEYNGRPPGFTPNEETVNAIKQQADSIQFVVFMGTWCEDSRFVVPRLLFLLDVAGYSKDRLTLIACDRNKKTLGNLTEPFQIRNVPTIVVMKKGKELGRVVEYGSGLFDKDLGEIIRKK